MAFNIKNAEADRLLRELVALTGEDLTTAVIHALRDRLDAARREATFEERLRAFRAWRERVIAATPPDAPSYAAIDADMYDEDGLPR